MGDIDYNKTYPNFSKEDGEKRWMIHLHHPCYEVHLWEVSTQEEENIAKRQGYMLLDQVRYWVKCMILATAVHKSGVNK
jgi:hypothetical protein